MEGIIKTEVGYCGGKYLNPTYNNVCQGKTEHAETIKLIYDPQKITYLNLIKFFFIIHNPTTLNRQGNNIGKQYRSIIFYSNEKEKKTYLYFLNSLKNKENIVTELKSKSKFYKAEDYHQNYLEKKNILL